MSSPKFTAPIVDTPKSITVITREVMEERGTPTMQDVLRTVPGITLGQGEGGTPNGDRPVIRGFTSDADVTLDGLRLGSIQTSDMFNTESIEVIKGASSNYGGRGTAGGSINMVSKTAKASNFQEGAVTFGSDMTKRVTGDVNYVVNDDIGVRLNAMYHDADVAGRDEVEVNRYGIAPTITFGMNSPTKATLSYIHTRTDDIPDYGHPYDPRTGKPVDVDRDNFYGLTNRDFQNVQLDAGTLRLEHEFNDNFTLANTTRYSVSSNVTIVTTPNDSAPNNIENGTVYRAPKSRNSQAELIVNQTDLKGKFDTGEIKHSYITGIEVSKESNRNRNFTIASGSNQCTTAQLNAYNCTSLFNPDPNDPWNGSITQSGTYTETKSKTWALYAFDTLELTPQWSINLGLRYDNFLSEAESSTAFLSNRSEFLNYQAGVVYKPAPNGSIYASYNTSASPSGTTGGEGDGNISATNDSLDPEETVAYEIGTKWDLFRGKLTTTGALFRNEKTNARQTSPITGEDNILVGVQRIDGAELGLAGAISDKWKVFSGYTLMLSEIVDDGPASSNEGNQVPNTPMHSLSLWSTYDILKDITIGGGAVYMSEREARADNKRGVPDSWRFDAMASYKLNEAVDFRLNVNNIFDETIYDKLHANHMAGVAPGRVVLLTTNFKF
jgi:catecholate siderophore receptor